MKKGDKVRLISLAKDSSESQNWIRKEKDIKVGGIFTISKISDDCDILWASFDELDYSHPLCKFELVNKVNTPEYYNNLQGSLYKIASDRNWNAYLFDVVKRLERGGKKDPLKQEIEKSIAVLQIWLTEL